MGASVVLAREANTFFINLLSVTHSTQTSCVVWFTCEGNKLAYSKILGC